MSEVITAIYENGVLRPLAPIALAEHQTVRLQILSIQEAEHANYIFQTLNEAGILTSPKGFSKLEPLTDEEQRELAKTLGKAAKKPLSETIIEDRGEW